MNKTRLFGIAVVLFSLTVCLYGQKKEINRKEYDELINKVSENTSKYSYRTINVRNLYRQDGITIQQTEKNLSEHVPSGNRRFLSEIVNHVINRTTITELIRIDGIEHRKVDNGKWGIVSSRTVIGNENIVSKEYKYQKYYLTENVQVDGQTVDILEYENEYTLKYKNSSNGEIKETKSYSRWKWTIKDNLFLRSESLSEKADPKMNVSNSITNYEYDPNIKIEAPIKTEALK